MTPVLIINDHARVTGGQAKVAIESALGLAARGVPVTFFGQQGPPDPRLAQACRVDLLDRPDLLSNPSKLDAMTSGLWSRGAARRLRALLEEMPADTLVHVHGWAKGLSPAIAPVLRGRRVVQTMHDYFLVCPNGGFYDYPAQAICTRRALGAACLARNCDVRSRSHKLWRVARQGVLHVAGGWPHRLTDVIAVSPLQVQLMAPYLRGTSVHEVPNPIDLPDLPRIDPAANRRALFIGRLSPEKGAALAVEAAALAGVPIRVVGEGEEADRLRQINPDADLTGWLSPDRVQDEIAAARCVIFPSLWYETAGLVPLEAMARGVPVLVAAWTAAAGIVGPDAGRLIDSREPADWAAALGEFEDDAVVRAAGALAAARADAVAVDLEGHVDRLLDLYPRIAA